MAIKYTSIDPGVRRVAYAVWNEDGSLDSAGLVDHEFDPGLERAEKWRQVAYWANIEIGIDDLDNFLIIEVPQVYSGPRDEDPNDLIDLAGVIGALVTYSMAGVEWSPRPKEWKGQLPKAISQKRVDERLTDEEKAKIKWPIKSLKHNVYDALHLGLTYLEREGIRLK